MKLENFEEKIKTSVMNFLWPGFGYYHNEKKEEGLKVMGIYLLVVLFTMAFNSPGLLIFPFLFNMGTVIHPLTTQKINLKRRKKEKLLEKYTKETLSEISRRVNRSYQSYIDLKSKMGESNRDIIQLKHHISSLKIHYQKAKDSFNAKEYERATDEATFSYKMVRNIERDVKYLEDKYREFTVLK